jgi:hypothetical protein
VVNFVLGCRVSLFGIALSVFGVFTQDVRRLEGVCLLSLKRELRFFLVVTDIDKRGSVFGLLKCFANDDRDRLTVKIDFVCVQVWNG